MRACPSCTALNEDDSVFCEVCGSPLSRCPTCSATTRPGQRFRRNCGTALTTTADAPATGTPGRPVVERRVCSVLFCDLVGFTSLSEARDAEEVRELLSRYFEIARMVIGRYGGVVEKFIGDAVMAVWGTPTRHRGGRGTCGASRRWTWSTPWTSWAERPGRTAWRLGRAW